MNEEQKNIETCLAENILSEVANVPTDPQFVSLNDEALDPLKQQALQQAGYDGYIKVAGTHQPYTFTSQVKQMKSNLILLLRRLWRFPFGMGTLRSLADMWQHYITRLHGNPEYGIPSRLSQLSDLPSAPALLADRDMSSGIRFGETTIPDGMSLINFLCSDKNLKSSVTEIVDTNVGWTMNKAISGFPNLEKVELGCVKATTSTGIPANTKSVLFPYLEDFDRGVLMVCDGDGELLFPKLRHIRAVNANTNTINLKKAKKLVMPSLVNVETIGNVTFCTGAELEEIEWKSFVGYGPGLWGGSTTLIGECPNLKKVVFGKLQYSLKQSNTDSSILSLGANCVHLEFGEGTAVALLLNTWNPTMALRTNTDAEDYVDLREDMTLANNLQQFLSNFKTYIAQRLTYKGSGLTLTLSQEVRNAIHAAEDEYGIENIIITQKGWTISPAPN
ncbi:MAG: hypothetical protein MR787_01905 [Bacteroidales bacterium]|nr:hypothetical protein [Bacteroidales bacterium]